MYTEFWGLQRRPFDERQSADMYFPAASQQSALLKLRYMVDQRKGLAVIAGEHGLGKSLLTQVFEKQSPTTPVIRLVIPNLSADESVAYFASRLGCPSEALGSNVSVLCCLEEKLAQLQSEQIHVVFVVDDAHLLDGHHLDTLRLLSCLNETGAADFSMVLVGRTQLLGRLSHIESLNCRIALRAAVTPLGVTEVIPYVRHRIAIAGGDPAIFQDECEDALWRHSRGIPRRVNQICDLALLVGLADELKSIGAIDIVAAAEELDSTLGPSAAAVAA
ncbi:MAG: AAA family ATPase [Planctomycetaceae bacterium]